MSTNSMLHQAKLNEWASRFIEQKASGLSVSEWCRQNNQSRYKFFYWKRLLKEEAALQVLPDIVPLSVPSVSPQLQPDFKFPTTSELGNTPFNIYVKRNITDNNYQTNSRDGQDRTNGELQNAIYIKDYFSAKNIYNQAS